MERIIFDNYDVDFDSAKEILIDNGNENPSDDAVWDFISEDMSYAWNEILEELDEILDGNLIAFGTLGKWNGTISGWQTFDSIGKLIEWALKDCDYWKLTETNGHLRLVSSHHDGSNAIEIKKLTENGNRFYENWAYSCDTRTSKEIGDKLVKRYSRLPHYIRRCRNGI